MNKIKILSVLMGAVVLSYSCTKLDEKLRDSLNSSSSSVNAAGLLQSAYESMNAPLQDQTGVWSGQEMTADDAIGPTRGPDWDDNGVWRVLHAHSWNADHAFLRDTYRNLLSVQFAASSVLDRDPTPQQAAEARFIRALSTFYVLDGWDQVPYRTDLSDYGKLPITIQGSAAADTIISELNAIIPDLQDANVIKASKDAARTLLMKTYLNRGVYKNRTAPTFDAADMNQVITLADQIINSGRYTLNPNFFQTFAADNSKNNKEIIFSLENTVGVRGGNNRFQWFCTLHYNQRPSGWNGFTTLADFYDKFLVTPTDTTDKRIGGEYNTGIYNGVTNVTGLRVGLLVGQQYNETRAALKDRKGNALAFTRHVALKETGNDLEITGIRVVKYPPDFAQGVDGNAENEMVIFRYADVLLMKAEALFRTGKATEALAIINQVRAARNASALGTVTEDVLFEERGRELYWEGWRRNDMIRFKKFLLPLNAGAGTTSTRPTATDPKYIIFPIPNQQLAVNPNLKQNPGYN